MSGPAKLPNPILMAAQKKHPDLVMAILEHRMAPKIDVNERDEDGCTALGHIVQSHLGDQGRKAADALIHAGAKADAQEPDLSARSSGEGPRATRRPRRHLAELCLASYSSPWREVFAAVGPKRLRALSSELSLLNHAVSRGNKEAAESLLLAGADPNRDDADLGLPIASCTTPPMFALLVAAGAKLNLPDHGGMTALRRISSSNVDAQVLSMATVAAQAEATGKTVTFKEGEQEPPRRKAGEEIAKPLLDALFDAIDKKSASRVQSLWKTLGLGRHKTRAKNARDAKGRTLLHAAIAARAFPLARRLMERGVDVNVFADGGETPATLLLGLTHDERAERDRRGERRAKFCAETMQRVRWDERSAAGIGYYEALFPLAIEHANHFSASTAASLAEPSRPDWLAMSADGSSCMLSRVLGKLLAERSVPNHSVGEIHERRQAMALVLADQIARPEFGSAQASALLSSALGKRQQSSLGYTNVWTRGILDALEKNLEAIKSTGVDPDSIEWASILAERRPTLHAAIESWRIAGASRAANGPRARSRSL